MMTRDQMKVVLDAIKAALSDDKPYIQKCSLAESLLTAALADEFTEVSDDLTIAYMSGFHAGKKAALAEPSEPVAWRYKTKADWNANWSNWVPCSKEQYDDYVKVSKLHDWVYDAQALFTHPASNHLDEISKVLHYPDCWDTAAYPTLEDAIIEAKSWAHCTNEDCQCPTKDA